jgi:hypothetical protein
MRVEHEYDRAGALAYLAAYDVHRGKVFGRCEPTTGIEAFGRLVEQVMTAEPYASAKRVFGWSTTAARIAARPRSTAFRAPSRTCGSSTCQCMRPGWIREIYFSVLQRKVLSPNDFSDLAEIEARLAAFESRYNAVARPFDWKFSRDDLNKLLVRIAAHEQAVPLALASAA